MLVNYAVHERLLRTSEDFVWPVDSTFHGRFIIDVEFLDLKICPLNVSSSALPFYCVRMMVSVNFYLLLCVCVKLNGFEIISFLLSDFFTNLVYPSP